MSTIVDRRKSGKNKSVGNRQKFIKRYKHRIKDAVDTIASDRGITDVLKDRKVIINENEIDEPNFNFDLTTGERDLIFPGNKNMQKGDKIRRDRDEEESGGGGPGEDGLDEFSFTLTKDEFLDLYFSDMALPDFIKESLKGTNKYKWKRTGYSKEGIPPRLDLVKTLKQGLARRIATRKPCSNCQGKGEGWSSKMLVVDGFSRYQDKCVECDGTGYSGKQRFLDDIDLRYKHFTKQPYPVRQATMICLMDVSGSMGEYEKGIAKKFFLLLYLFLHKVYKKVDVIFISHTEHAKEVTEEEFFYSQDNGGTVVSSGLKLAKDIIDTRIDLATTNVYISQASDGDNWGDDDDISINLMEDLLGKTQYYAYIQTEQLRRRQFKEQRGVEDLMTLYLTLAEKHKNLQCRHVESEADVYPVLRSLFESK